MRDWHMIEALGALLLIVAQIVRSGKTVEDVTQYLKDLLKK